MIIHPQKKKHPYLLAVLPMVAVALIAGIGGYVSYGTPVRASIAPETLVTIQCDKDTIIKAHYIEVLDAMDIAYNPVYVAPERKLTK